MNLPVLVLAFNRPDTLSVLLERLQALGANEVYFAVDGPRDDRPDDEPKVNAVKHLIARTFDPPQTRCLYHEHNLGIRWAPPSGISWFLEKVEAGVILEDDCIPGDSFFSFVAWALKRYEAVSEVKLISGFNRFGSCKWPESHHFLKTPIIWGWATWRRAWIEYDPLMANHADEATLRRLRRWSGSFAVFDYWRDAAQMVLEGRLVTWDVAWCWAVLVHRGMVVFPRENLVRNIGFGSDATNTLGVDDRANVPCGPLSAPYREPRRQIPDRILQQKIDRLEFWRGQRTVYGIARQLAKRFLGR